MQPDIAQQASFRRRSNNPKNFEGFTQAYINLRAQTSHSKLRNTPYLLRFTSTDGSPESIPRLLVPANPDRMSLIIVAPWLVANPVGSFYFFSFEYPPKMPSSLGGGVSSYGIPFGGISNIVLSGGVFRSGVISIDAIWATYTFDLPYPPNLTPDYILAYEGTLAVADQARQTPPPPYSKQNPYSHMLGHPK